MRNFMNGLKNFAGKVAQAVGFTTEAKTAEAMNTATNTAGEAISGRCTVPGAGGFYSQHNPGINHGFKQNQRRERKLSRKRRR